MIQTELRSPGGPAAEVAPQAAADRAFVVRGLQRSELFREFQGAFEATTGLPLVLREAGSFRSPLQGSKRINPFCVLMTRGNASCAACLQLQQQIEDEAVQEAKTLTCYAGLSESVVPVRSGNDVLGYLQTGQIFLRKPTRERFGIAVRLTAGGEAGDADGDREREAAYFQTRVFDRTQYLMILRLLGVFAQHLGLVSNQLLIGRTPADTGFVTKMRAFVARRHGEPLSLRDAARAANMSPFYFCKVFKGATGLTFMGYLARVRIEAAKALLLDVDLRISEAAFAAGFQSLSQFNRVFRRITGEAPSGYRDRVHGREAVNRRPGVVRERTALGEPVNELVEANVG